MSLNDLVAIVRRHVLAMCSPDSCIATTRATIEVMHYFGMDARPQAAHVKVFSPLAAGLLEKAVPLQEWPPQARYVHLGDTGEVRPGRWDGHLVATYQRAGQLVLIDGSIDQAARPERNIVIPEPIVADITGTGLPTRITLPSGTSLLYYALDNAGYLTSPNWRQPGKLRSAIAGAIRELKETP